jgi:hypothetical protein
MSNLPTTKTPAPMTLAYLAFKGMEAGLEDPMAILLAMHKTALAEGIGAVDCDVEDDFVQSLIWYARAGAGHQEVLDEGTEELRRVRGDVLTRIGVFQTLSNVGRIGYPGIIFAIAGFLIFKEQSSWLLPIIGAGALCFAGIFIVLGDPLMGHVAKRIRTKEARRQTARNVYLTGILCIVMGLDEFQLRTRIWNTISNPVARKRLGLEKPMPSSPQASTDANRRRSSRTRWRSKRGRSSLMEDVGAT